MNIRATTTLLIVVTFTSLYCPVLVLAAERIHIADANKYVVPTDKKVILEENFVIQGVGASGPGGSISKGMSIGHEHHSQWVRGDYGLDEGRTLNYLDLEVTGAARKSMPAGVHVRLAGISSERNTPKPNEQLPWINVERAVCTFWTYDEVERLLGDSVSRNNEACDNIVKRLKAENGVFTWSNTEHRITVVVIISEICVAAMAERGDAANMRYPQSVSGKVIVAVDQASPSSDTETMDALKKLKSLKDEGILTEEEYQKKRTELLKKMGL